MSKEIIIETTREVFIKPYTHMDLAELYGISYKTLYKWLKPFRDELGKKQGYYYTIPQVKIIFEKLDYPTLSVVRIKEKASE